jgi:antitoxin ParD1/3/4
MTMNVSVGERWEGFVADIVKACRYGSASEVVREGFGWLKSAKKS